jgi:hypothetical protein
MGTPATVEQLEIDPFPGLARSITPHSTTDTFPDYLDLIGGSVVNNAESFASRMLAR